MKKIVPIYFLIIISLIFLFFPKIIFATGATGTIQFMSFPKQISESVGSEFSIPFGFVYSGSYSRQLGASMTGSIGTNTLSLSSVNQGANGIDDVIFSGTPTSPGDYFLTLIVTDNNGALLDQTFHFIIYPSPNNYSLPDAVVNSLSYTQNVPFINNYKNYNSVLVYFSAYSTQNGQTNSPTTDIKLTFTNAPLEIDWNQDVGVAELDLVAYKAGQYTIKADVTENDDALGTIIDTKMFNLTVDSTAVAKPVITGNNSVSNQGTGQIATNTLPASNTTMCNRKVWNDCPAGQTFYCPPTGDAQCLINQQSAVQSTTTTNTLPAGCTSTSGFSPTTGISCSSLPRATNQNTQAQPKTKSKISNNIFSNIWNFIKNIFK